MRVLLLSNLYPPYIRGGAEITAGDIATGLKERGHEVKVLTSWDGLPSARKDGDVWRTLRLAEPARFDRHIPVLRQLRHLVNYRQEYYCAENARELARVVAETQPDILYIWEINRLGLISLLRELPKFSFPIVFHLGSYWWQYIHSPETEYSHLRLRSLKKLLIGSVPPLTYTSLIAVSGAVKQEYVKAGCDAERIEVINSGIDPRFMDLPRTESFAGISTAGSQGVAGEANPYATKQGARLVYAGRIRVEKGILTALKALNVLVEEGRNDFHLNIFGEGDEGYINTLQSYVREQRLDSFVTFHGKIPQDDLIKYYDLSDIMLVPSLWQEPFGLVVAEAMARGLPVIASDVGGPAEMITDNVDGLLFEPGNERALASAIARLLDAPEERQRLIQTGHATVRNRFTIAENIRRAEQHLLRAVASTDGAVTASRV